MLSTGVYARIGIGENKILAKMACDNFAKKNKNGIFTLAKNSLIGCFANSSEKISSLVKLKIA
jgi:nucleotidyltransferase/DNA polymerase involved in DNA repair